MTQTAYANGHPSYVQLSAFVDNELPVHEAQMLRQHLTECHECALRVLSNTQVKKAVTRAGDRFSPGPEVLERLSSQLLETKRPRRALPVKTWSWAAIAASLILTVTLAGRWQFIQARNLNTEMLDQHLAVLSSGAMPQVISTDRHTVKPWFQGKLPFSFNLPDKLPAGAELKGGDLTFIAGKPAATLIFAIGKHNVSVFLTQRSRGEITAALSSVQAGFQIKHASTSALNITAVSDVNPAELDLLVETLVEAQSSQ